MVEPAPCGVRPALVTLAGVLLTRALVSNLFPRACITRTLKLNDLNQHYRGAVWFVRVAAWRVPAAGGQPVDAAGLALSRANRS